MFCHRLIALITLCSGQRTLYSYMCNKGNIYMLPRQMLIIEESNKIHNSSVCQIGSVGHIHKTGSVRDPLVSFKWNRILLLMLLSLSNHWCVNWQRDAFHSRRPRESITSIDSWFVVRRWRQLQTRVLPPRTCPWRCSNWGGLYSEWPDPLEIWSGVSYWKRKPSFEQHVITHSSTEKHMYITTIRQYNQTALTESWKRLLNNWSH